VKGHAVHDLLTEREQQSDTMAAVRPTTAPAHPFNRRFTSR